MKTTLMIAAATLGLMAAGGAQAQVLGGGLGGNIGGGVSVTRGDLGARDTLGAARDFARDTVSRTRDAGRLDGSASLEVTTSGGASLDRNGATVDFSGSYGAEVNSRNGDALGRVVGLAQDSAAGARYVLVQGADGAVRGVRTTELEVAANGELDSDLTAYSFRRLPEQQASGSSGLTDDGRRSRQPSEVDEYN